MDEPIYLQDSNTEEAIKQRMIDTLPDDLDKNEGGYLHDAISPAAIELSMAAEMAKEVLRRGFASTAASKVAGEKTVWLEQRAAEHGLIRRAAVKATGTVIFTGTDGTIIPAGTQVSTASTESVPAIIFQTTDQATIAEGSVAVGIEAIVGGKDGIVAAGTIIYMVIPVAGVSTVTNAAATTGGIDEEDDISLFARYLQKVQSPSAGGNKADYVNWALEVSGVGGVSVVPVRDGPGTVSVAIINTNKKPADQALVDAAQDHIAPRWEHTEQAENMTIGGHGVTIDATQEDDIGSSAKMEYDAAGVGTLTQVDIEQLLDRPGVWQARVHTKVDDIAGGNDLLQVGIWDASAAAWAKTTPSSGIDALLIYAANEYGSAGVFEEKIIQFYWDGQSQLELRVTRLQSDNATIVWIDQAKHISTFSMDTGEGKAPVGATVTVEPAISVLINVSATLAIATGYNEASVRAAAEQNIDTYLKALALAQNNDVNYISIGQAIQETDGVQFVADLLVNNDTINIIIGGQEVAIKGSVALL